MILKNNFLDTLNAHYDPNLYASTDLYLVAGEGYSTIETFELMPYCNGKLWVDGKVIDCIYSTEGDGTNLVRSVFTLSGYHYVLASDYESLLLNAEPIYLPLL